MNNKKVMSIIWLRGQQLRTNSQYAVLILLPYIFAVMYKYLLPQNEVDDHIILLVCLPMLFSISVGNLISSIVAEEKEKNNLKELYLSGLNNIEYVLGSVFYPMLFAILGIIGIPILIGENNFESYITYLSISFLTGISILLINLFIGIISKSLNQAQIVGIPIMMITMLLPIFASYNESIANYTKYTYVGSFMELFHTQDKFNFSNTSFCALILWIFTLIGLCLWGFKNIKTKK